MSVERLSESNIPIHLPAIGTMVCFPALIYRHLSLQANRGENRLAITFFMDNRTVCAAERLDQGLVELGPRMKKGKRRRGVKGILGDPQPETGSEIEDKDWSEDAIDQEERNREWALWREVTMGMLGRMETVTKDGKCIVRSARAAALPCLSYHDM